MPTGSQTVRILQFYPLLLRLSWQPRIKGFSRQNPGFPALVTFRRGLWCLPLPGGPGGLCPPARLQVQKEKTLAARQSADVS